MVIYTALERHPELQFHQGVDLNEVKYPCPSMTIYLNIRYLLFVQLISGAVDLFLSENAQLKHAAKVKAIDICSKSFCRLTVDCLEAEGLKVFFDIPPLGNHGTTSYLARIVSKQLLLGGVHDKPGSDCIHNVQ